MANNKTEKELEYLKKIIKEYFEIDKLPVTKKSVEMRTEIIALIHN